jgi:hypothetical protein
MLGGTADIDLVFVHKTCRKKTREFVKLTPDFHLDISRRAKDEFKSPRDLRGDPWLGYEMYDPSCCTNARSSSTSCKPACGQVSSSNSRRSCFSAAASC